MRYQVVYLTGAPASGKTTVVSELKTLVKGLEVWAFGDRLHQLLQTKLGYSFPYEELRQRSAELVTPQIISDLDDKLIEFAAEARTRCCVVIESHPVTRESYGFRITPYSAERVRRLGLTQIWVLYAAPELIVSRIANKPGGRPNVSLEDARSHSQLQASVAIGYGLATGLPVHFFETTGNPKTLARQLAKRLDQIFP